MRRLISRLTLLSVGLVLGWIAHEVYAPTSDGARDTAAVPSAGTASNANDSMSRPTDDVAANTLRVYLDAGRYPDAVQWLVTAHAAGPMNPALEQDVLALEEHISALAGAGRGAQAHALLDDILAVLPAFIDARWMLAQLQIEEKQYEKSVDTLYSGRSYVATLDDLQRIERQIKQTVSTSHGQLVACCDAARLAAFYEHLVALDSSRTDYYVALAQAYADGGRLNAATKTLSMVLHDPEVGAQARSLLAKLEGRASDGTQIPLQRHGNQYLVPVLFNDSVELTLLLDTGASMTVLSAAAFDVLRAAATPLGERALTTANGKVVAQVFRVSSVAVGGRRVDDVVVAVVDQLDESGLAGLLGMDYLDDFQFSIDRQADALYLMPPRHSANAKFLRPR